MAFYSPSSLFSRLNTKVQTKELSGIFGDKFSLNDKQKEKVRSIESKPMPFSNCDEYSKYPERTYRFNRKIRYKHEPEQE